ncbi:helix-turn-helix domain-containing protein [Nocardiopsis algeriensis]|uniref:Excisionase family DNA binding protein n=1 Tax=Nocardiopsis algeriensis TaxID=1478215 RepID=A0A841INP7_9ACTN|nr:helix-turn-helix domain-containing protein [Nocardiopsis algeriensis]MBB6119714.1 excisionase family DNA binding protein [Nocardiopsis algeriensis]
MATALNRVVEDIAPPASEEQREATRAAISQILSDTAQVALRLPGGEEYRLDRDELRVLLAIALARANGQRVSVISHDVMLSPQQAAELLGVSRPMVYRFIERGDLAATRVGTHWRLLTADVLALAERRTRLADGVDTGLDHVARAMTSSRQGTAAKDGAKESWRAATPEQKEASLERVRRRTRSRRQ